MSKRNSSRSANDAYKSRNKNKNEKLGNYASRSMVVKPTFQNGMLLTNPIVVSPLKTSSKKNKSGVGESLRTTQSVRSSTPLKNSSNKTKSEVGESLRTTHSLRSPTKRSNLEYMRSKTPHKTKTLDSGMPYLRHTSLDRRNRSAKHIYSDSNQKKGLCERHAKLINSNVTSSSSNVLLDAMCPVCQDVSKIMMLKSKDIYPYPLLNKSMVQEEKKRVDKEFTTSILKQGNNLLLKSPRNSQERTNESKTDTMKTDTMAEVTAFLNKHVARLNEEKKTDPETEKPPVSNVQVLTPVEPAKADIKVKVENVEKLKKEPIMIDIRKKEDLVGCGKKLKEMMEKHEDLLNKLKDYETQNKVIQERLNHFDKLKNSLLTKQAISGTKEEEECEEDLQEDIDTMIMDYLMGKKITGYRKEKDLAGL